MNTTKQACSLEITSKTGHEKIVCLLRIVRTNSGDSLIMDQLCRVQGKGVKWRTIRALKMLLIEFWTFDLFLCFLSIMLSEDMDFLSIVLYKG